jgi:DNA-binding NarL/FixJ family response regulator
MLAQSDETLEVLEAANDRQEAADVLVVADPDDLASLAHNSDQGVVVLADDDAVVALLRSLPLRGWAIVPTDATADELRAAVLAAAHGMIALPLAMAGHVAPATSALRSANAPDLRQPLTPRELEVLELVSRGLPSKLIAQSLAVSESTVKYHLSSIYAKLGVASRTEAVSRAARLGLITL